MLRRTHLGAWILGLVLVSMLASPAAAQQSLSLNIGAFTPRGESNRVAGDTLVENLYAQSPFALDYRISDFNGVTFGAEWLFPVGDFLEGGIGANYYQRTVPSRYMDIVNTDGRDITQDLKLRTVPVTATLRFLLTGRHAAVQPYVGAGVAVIPWRYSESGDFADPSLSIFTYEYKDSGTAVGPVIFAGVRAPVTRSFLLGGEVRWQRADANLDRTVEFSGNKLDLGGLTYQANFIFRF